MLTLWRNARLVTLTGESPWGWIEPGALVVDDDRLLWVGDLRRLPRQLPITAEHDLDGMLVTPGLVDCHTHLIYAGTRADEFEARLHGATYADIARHGGGILSTVRATRAASDDDLLTAACRRARALLAEGVTTLEVKSGYGLTYNDEARCLRVARRLGETLPITVSATYLAAHALPPEFAGRADDYIAEVCAWLPDLQSAGLVDAVDAFCETIGFSPEQTRRVFQTARRLGLPVKLHAEQLSDQSGAALAAEFGALSCDHLEYLSASGIRAMAAAGTVAVLLPGAFYVLGETRRPPVVALREAGIPIAIATDHNPGSSPVLSLLAMLNLACVLFRLTPAEALRGVTKCAAQALGLSDRGVLAAGKRADFAVWALDHPRELTYWLGGCRPRRVVSGGREVIRDDVGHDTCHDL
ncbi:MAG: imidazolonepropionase [Chloracidobacterium sp.]|uniref:Imidazolonepropionase n=1 Tax=Chloracidobacterium validum TaxID=2821543 RepID=A0ABX8B6M0_9BACT|nr:imidazolonepropionase [Chloracidobacterium validum]QUW02281.1 imidazolonepropionase [Chloracidobacterium validum]